MPWSENGASARLPKLELNKDLKQAIREIVRGEVEQALASL